MKEEYLQIWNLTVGEEGTGLNRFHLRMSKGDFVELLGTERAGKTALGAFFSGKEPITEGFARLGGRTFGPGETIDSSLVYCVRQRTSLAASLTVAENILLLNGRYQMLSIVNRRALEARVSFLLAEFGFLIPANKRVDSLNEGEKRIVELMRAVEMEVPFVFIDNICASLGQTDIQMLERCLAGMKKRGITILAMGGGFPLFGELSERVVVLRGGKNVRTFYRGTFDREEYVKWVFGGGIPEKIREEASIHLASMRRTALPEAREVLGTSGLSGDSIRNFTTSIGCGEIVGLYDMNNLKNLEFIRILMGEIPVSSGEIFLDGKKYLPGRADREVQRGICYIPRNIQDCAVINNMSLGENILLPVMRKNSLFGIFPVRRIVRFLQNEYGAEYGTEDFEKKTVYHLDSLGRMRVVLQKILIRRPVLLLVEDVVSDMNIRMLRLQTDYFARLKKQGCAILVASQNLNALRQICDRILVMNTE